MAPIFPYEFESDSEPEDVYESGVYIGTLFNLLENIWATFSNK